MFRPDNLYYEAMKSNIEAREKGLPVVPKKQRRKERKEKKQDKKKTKKNKGGAA